MTLFLMEVGRKGAKEAELLRVCNERRETKYPSYTILYSSREGERGIVHL